MKHLAINISACSSKEDLYRVLLSALEAPDWHGDNLDALWDSITSDLNGVMPPYVIEVSGKDVVPPEVTALLRRFEAIFMETERDRALPISMRLV